MGMMQTEIAGKVYNVAACFACSGSGQSFDSTNQDSAIGAGAVVKCAHCGGRGKTYRMASMAQPAFVPNIDQPISEMPDWMC